MSASSDIKSAEKNSASSSVAGWNEFIEALRVLPERMLAKLPESMRASELVQQEVARLALEALTSVSIDTIGGDANNPTFLPALGQVLNVGQPNADTVYRTARIAPDGSYRLRGKRGSLRMANIGQVVPRNVETGSGRTYLDINTLKVDKDDCFDVLLSSKRPAAYTGDWWELRPAANKLMMRLVSCDWANEQSPTIAIERIDKPTGSPRRSAQDLEQRLRTLPVALNFLGPMFVDHVEQLRAEGYLNKLKSFDMTNTGGLVGQYYYEGAYDLCDDEAIIVEAKVPDRCGYYSVILTNEIYETIDWYNNHSSLNNEQAVLDKDRVLRVVISSRDPGVPNWLDTAGHPRGVIQGRWAECDAHPTPLIRKVALADVRQFLPAETGSVTREQREHTIRERRAALQQRPLW